MGIYIGHLFSHDTEGRVFTLTPYADDGYLTLEIKEANRLDLTPDQLVELGEQLITFGKGIDRGKDVEV